MWFVDNYTPFKGKVDLLFYSMSGAAAGGFTAALLNPLGNVTLIFSLSLSFLPLPSLSSSHPYCECSRGDHISQLRFFFNIVDVVKTRYQVLSLDGGAGGNMTVWSTVNKLWAEEGIYAFKRGITAR